MKLKSLGILGLLLSLCVFMAVMTADPWYDVTGSTFLQSNNIENLLRRTAMYGILGIGVSFVIITSGIDLSVGSIVCLSGCFLAMFLNVDYRAFDQKDVFQVAAQQKTIVVHGDASEYKAGDRIRFFGGRRARNALVTVVKVEQVSLYTESQDYVGPGTVISVDQPLSRDDDGGHVAKVYSLVNIDAANQRVTIGGDHANLAARDQIVLVHPTSGLKQLTIASATTTGSATTVTLSKSLGSDLTTQWLAIPLERRQRMPIPLALLIGARNRAVVGLGPRPAGDTLEALQPFVVTLCGLLIYRGLSRWLVNDQPVVFRQ